jgi:hypothetical protein
MVTLYLIRTSGSTGPMVMLGSKRAIPNAIWVMTTLGMAGSEEEAARYNSLGDPKFADINGVDEMGDCIRTGFQITEHTEYSLEMQTEIYRWLKEPVQL